MHATCAQQLVNHLIPITLRHKNRCYKQRLSWQILNQKVIRKLANIQLPILTLILLLVQLSHLHIVLLHFVPLA